MSHTPGPWKYEERAGAGIQIWAPVDLGPSKCEATDTAIGPRLQPIYEASVKPQLVVGEDGTVTAMISYESWRQFPTVAFDEMQRANARLIAAAPDFYEAAKEILAAFECKAFVRNTLLDHESDWAIKALPHLQALAKLAQAIEKVDATPVVEAKVS